MPPVREEMQIFVKNVHTGSVLTIEVEGDDTVDELKEKVEKEGERLKKGSGVRPALQRLSHNSVDMMGGRRLADYGMHMEAELLLVVRPERPRAEQQGTTIEELTRLSGMSTGLVFFGALALAVAVGFYVREP